VDALQCVSPPKESKCDGHPRNGNRWVPLLASSRVLYFNHLDVRLLDSLRKIEPLSGRSFALETRASETVRERFKGVVTLVITWWRKTFIDSGNRT